ncbi:hypothetical protein [Rhizobium sp. LC145]|jgi:hypothetical protein|uniref:hypothetical protein n=1 Tax=Rhizobium sp. LC145 TaxID=1120688 RepID=UPI00069BFAE4|nr:hypothetical protein [Rhizobium sp. LC145]TKT46204.1 hypothetical protein FDR95_23285 [Rhizobiaceae bacterium LC148]
MKKILISALALVMVSAVPTLAQTYRSEARENRQEYRVYRGMARGELTPQELRGLRRQQDEIDRYQRHAARDGYISPRERQKIERMQDRASRYIRNKTHNDRYLD